MKKRNFLMPLAALAAAFTAGEASAKTEEPPITTEGEASKEFKAPASSEKVSAIHGQDQFDFILKRGEQGQFMAYHTSHSSHSSHSSHRSHYSSRY